jgi:hypothetical protein
MSNLCPVTNNHRHKTWRQHQRDSRCSPLHGAPSSSRQQQRALPFSGCGASLRRGPQAPTMVRIAYRFRLHTTVTEFHQTPTNQACSANIPLTRRTPPRRRHTPRLGRSTTRTLRPASCQPTYHYLSSSTAWEAHLLNLFLFSPASSTLRHVWRSIYQVADSASSNQTTSRPTRSRPTPSW